MYYLGIDLGGTNIAAAVVDENYKIIGRAKLKTNLPRHQDEVLADLSVCAMLALENAKLTLKDIKWVGVGSPGTVNSDTGMVEYSNNTEFEHADVRHAIESTLHLPCFVGNDANAAAYGELIAGAGNGVKNFVAITLGTGVGGGVIVNGTMLTGFNHGGAELGHMIIDANGPLCTCGLHGCFETLSSATALIKQTKDAMEKDKSSALWDICSKDINNISGRSAFEGLRANDKTSKEVVNNYIKFLSIGVINIINIFQPEILCIGGGVSHEKEEFLLEPLKELVAKNTYGGNFLTNTKIMTAKLGNDAGIIGAAFLGNLKA